MELEFHDDMMRMEIVCSMIPVLKPRLGLIGDSSCALALGVITDVILAANDATELVPVVLSP